ncbi:MAG: hypothetical protein JWQ04_374 [Pedosphaera sp.]|nr:hypothetical protein [Pedosphaera sp.]
MNRGLSAYSGVAAVMVLGVGNLIVGFSLPPAMHERAVSMIHFGFGALGLALFILAIAVSSSMTTKFLIASAAAGLCAGILAYNAMRNELTGTATYHTFWRRHDVAEAVTRAGSPAKFHEATNLLWGAGIICFGAAAATFACYRKGAE